MLVVPVRAEKISEEGVLCRLGSEPTTDAPKELVPADCILNYSKTEESDLTVLILDPDKLPARLKSLLRLS